MKRLFALMLSLLLMLFFCGCSDGAGKTQIAGKTFCYEREGFGGEFSITLNDDGTMSYYEGGWSSYMGMGTWTQVDDIVILTDEVYPFCNRFQVQDGSLVFLERESTNFMYLQLKDGDCFFPVEA